MKKLILLALFLAPIVSFGQKVPKFYTKKKVKKTKGFYNVEIDEEKGFYKVQESTNDSGEKVYNVDGEFKKENERTTIDTGNNYFFIKEFLEKEGKKETTYSNDDD